jgi:hypothetical protein
VVVPGIDKLAREGQFLIEHLEPFLAREVTVSIGAMSLLIFVGYFKFEGGHAFDCISEAGDEFAGVAGIVGAGAAEGVSELASEGAGLLEAVGPGEVEEAIVPAMIAAGRSVGPGQAVCDMTG